MTELDKIIDTIVTLRASLTSRRGGAGTSPRSGLLRAHVEHCILDLQRLLSHLIAAPDAVLDMRRRAGCALTGDGVSQPCQLRWQGSLVTATPLPSRMTGIDRRSRYSPFRKSAAALLQVGSRRTSDRPCFANGADIAGARSNVLSVFRPGSSTSVPA